jgi:uncharacterized OB-fold protein
MIEESLLPEIDPVTAPFWEATVRGELVMQRCATEGCQRFRFPPRPMCPSCQSLESVWEPVSGRGTIWSYVVAHPPLLPAYAALAPYPVVVVALEEDASLRLVGNLLAREGGEINEVDPATIAIGDGVRVTFRRVADDVALPCWIRE